MNPKPSTFRNILTLRYDPEQSSPLPKLNWQDFTPKISNPSIDFVEKSIEKAIMSQLDDSSYKNIVMSLSGGIDSTLVLSMLKKTIPDFTIDAISIRFSNSIDESHKATKIANHFGVNHHVLSLENYLEELPKAISIVKLPFWDIHWYYVAKKAKTLSHILASGDGGDELFGGYTFRYKKFLSLINPNSTPLKKVDAYLQCHERDRVPDQEQVFNKKSEFSWKKIHEILIPYFDNPLSSLEQVFLADYNGKLLYNFAIVNSRINNHFGIKSLTPLLSEELISYANHLSDEYKFDKSRVRGKLLLRDLLKKLKADLFLTDVKQGFSVNTINLWKSYGHKLCQDYLVDSRIIKDGWIKEEWITKNINKDNLDVRYINKFLGLLAFEIWYRLFVTKEIKSDTLL